VCDKIGNSGAEDDGDDEVLLRRYVIPEEDRPRRTTYPAPYSGGYRWFRSANVICMEQYRRDRAKRESGDA
jgi:hypothetical protein